MRLEVWALSLVAIALVLAVNCIWMMLKIARLGRENLDLQSQKAFDNATSYRKGLDDAKALNRKRDREEGKKVGFTEGFAEGLRTARREFRDKAVGYLREALEVLEGEVDDAGSEAQDTALGEAPETTPKEGLNGERGADSMREEGGVAAQSITPLFDNLRPGSPSGMALPSASFMHNLSCLPEAMTVADRPLKEAKAYAQWTSWER